MAWKNATSIKLFFKAGIFQNYIAIIKFLRLLNYVILFRSLKISSFIMTCFWIPRSCYLRYFKRNTMFKAIKNCNRNTIFFIYFTLIAFKVVTWSSYNSTNKACFKATLYVVGVWNSALLLYKRETYFLVMTSFRFQFYFMSLFKKTYWIERILEIKWKVGRFKFIMP